jgi:hypothetical protein
MRVWFETHQHHYECETVFSQAAEPADLPIIEAGANRNGRFQSQKLRFRPHARRNSWLRGNGQSKDRVGEAR